MSVVAFDERSILVFRDIKVNYRARFPLFLLAIFIVLILLFFVVAIGQAFDELFVFFEEPVTILKKQLVLEHRDKPRELMHSGAT